MAQQLYEKSSAFWSASSIFRETRDPDERTKARTILIRMAIVDDAIGDRAADLLLAEDGLQVLRPIIASIVVPVREAEPA